MEPAGDYSHTLNEEGGHQHRRTRIDANHTHIRTSNIPLTMYIALYTTQIPPITDPKQEISAIVDLSKERALELLELMNDITRRAATSSTIFRISSFEANALIVPAYALNQGPAFNDFLILPEDFSVTDTTPIKLIHANVMPLYTNWSATDPDSNFILTTIDLNSQVLKLVARGDSLAPGSTNIALDNLTTLARSIITSEPKWLH